MDIIRHTSPPIRPTNQPMLGKCHPRSRLFQRLENAHVIWVSGPPGSGKTTLINSWVNTRPYPCYWHQLDNDETPHSLLAYLGKEDSNNSAVSNKHFFAQLYNQLPEHSALVLDNYQGNNELHEILSQALEAIPPHLRIIIISRRCPPPQLTRLRAYQILHHIDWPDLKLSWDEALSIAHLHEDISAQRINELHNQTQGWVTGLLLMLQADSKRELFNYLTNEVLVQANQETQDFLFRTCHLAHMNMAQAEQVSGMHSAGKILRYLCEHYCFTERTQTDEPCYSYHPMFSDFLSTCARKHLQSQNGETIAPVKIQLQDENIHIILHGQPIQFHGKHPKKPLELLRELIKCGGANVPESKLSDTLWPDSDGDNAYQSFKYTLHHLRKLLGSNETLKFAGGKLSLNTEICRVEMKNTNNYPKAI